MKVALNNGMVGHWPTGLCRPIYGGIDPAGSLTTGAIDKYEKWVANSTYLTTFDYDVSDSSCAISTYSEGTALPSTTNGITYTAVSVSSVAAITHSIKIPASGSDCATQCDQQVAVSDYCNSFTASQGGFLSNKFTSTGAVWYAAANCAGTGTTLTATDCSSAETATSPKCADRLTDAKAYYTQEVLSQVGTSYEASNEEQAKMLGTFFGSIIGYLCVVIVTIILVDMCFPNLVE